MEEKLRRQVIESVEEFGSDYLVRALGISVDDQRSVLKFRNTFAVFDRHGDVSALGPQGGRGLFNHGTRHLSHYALSVFGERPLLLGTEVDEDNVELRIDLTNPDIEAERHATNDDIPHNTIHILRSKVVGNRRCVERIELHNFNATKIHVPLRIEFGADFKDIFEVRGTKRRQRGEQLPATLQDRSAVLSYRGLDDVVRTTCVRASLQPTELTDNCMTFEIEVEAKSHVELEIAVECGSDGRALAQRTYAAVHERQTQTVRTYSENVCRIETSNEQFNTLLLRTYSDLFMMATETEHGLYPYAGVPWYSTVFGRDGIITALQCLWLAPALARGVLQYLAANQAVDDDPARDAEPGKILHEVRGGEMAALGEVPFGRYYGSIDATPLFVVLAAEYYRRTADLAFVQKLWPAIQRALEWITHYGDRDGDGYVEYARRRHDGLVNQGWKDSHDAVFHADGTTPKGPIALCEVQAYVYQAWVGAGTLAEALGDHVLSSRCRAEATALRDQFERDFWIEELGTYALALDGDKRPCAVRTSNAGHVLFGDLASPARAERVARGLFSEDMFSGWGIRTLSSQAGRYNPMSYHNGSVWPHDNAMIAAGLARYGHREEVNRVFGAIFDVSLFMELQRLPELFCGFKRRRAQGPTHYPVACSPQAWASGAVLMLLQASLALRVDAPNGEIVIDRPILPPFLLELSIKNLSVPGGGTLDLRLHRYGDDVGVHVERKDSDIRLKVLK